jgi:hypothetical protein
MRTFKKVMINVFKINPTLTRLFPLSISWPLRNNHISNDNGSFTFHVYVFPCYHLQDFYRTGLYIWVTRWMSFKKREMFTLHEYLISPPVFWWVVLLICLVFCVVLSYVYIVSSVTCCPLRFPHKVIKIIEQCRSDMRTFKKVMINVFKINPTLTRWIWCYINSISIIIQKGNWTS